MHENQRLTLPKQRCGLHTIITPPSSFPVSLGDIAKAGHRAQALPSIYRLRGYGEIHMSAPWSSATYDTGTYVLGNSSDRNLRLYSNENIMKRSVLILMAAAAFGVQHVPTTPRSPSP